MRPWPPCVRRFAKVLSVRGANVTAVVGEGVTSSKPVHAGGPLTVTGRVFVRELPPGGRIVLTAMILPPGERHSPDVGRKVLNAASGWQDFSLSGKAWEQTGRFTLEVNAYVGGGPYVIYRVARIPIDVAGGRCAAGQGQLTTGWGTRRRLFRLLHGARMRQRQTDFCFSTQSCILQSLAPWRPPVVATLPSLPATSRPPAQLGND